MKTLVELTNDGMYKDYKKGEKGYVDGYVRGANDVPLAVVVIKQRVELVELNHMKALGILKSTE